MVTKPTSSSPGRRKSGPPKGVPRPRKRALDKDFKDRFAAAMANQPQWDPVRLAEQVGCTRQVLYNYLNGKNSSIDALLLNEIARKLEVSAGWLLTGQGTMSRPVALSPDQMQVLDLLERMPSDGVRELWINNGEQLIRSQLALFATRSDPFNGQLPKPSPPATEQREAPLKSVANYSSSVRHKR